MLMRTIRFGVIAILITTFFLAGCHDEDETINKSCGVAAIVKDLRGLDGCGYVFELTDGTRLEPQRLLYCGTPPLSKEMLEDPLLNFEFVDGKQVRIGYTEIKDAMSVCMVGKVVKITCLEEVITEEKN